MKTKNIFEDSLSTLNTLFGLNTSSSPAEIILRKL